MACCPDGTLMGKLKSLIHDIEGGGCCPPCCPPPQCVPIPPNCEPCAVCCMVCPPPIMPPTHPEPVKPLRLPCPADTSQEVQMSEEEAERTRYANFYNNYNIDWHADSAAGRNGCPPVSNNNGQKCRNGVTLDGKNPCEDYKRKKPGYNADQSCPTGFKTCTMKLTPPMNCHPCGVWCAEIQPCPPKPKKKKQQQQQPLQGVCG